MSQSKEIGISTPDGKQARALLRDWLTEAIRAPSCYNSQPWLFREGVDYVDLLADSSRALPVADPDNRELFISCGALLGHLIVVARHGGHSLKIERSPDVDQPMLFARVRIGESVSESVHQNGLYNAIDERRTNREPFDSKHLPHDLLQHCRELVLGYGIDLTFIDDADKRSDIAELVATGDRLQFADKHFRRELSDWVHSRRAANKDGVSGDAFGLPDALSAAGGLAIRSFDMGKKVAEKDHSKITSSHSVLAVFSSPTDTVHDWLYTGQCLSDVLLNLTAAKATASYLNQAVEIASLRLKLADAINVNGVPQLLLRFGYGPNMPASVRRSVDDFFIV